MRRPVPPPPRDDDATQVMPIFGNTGGAGGGGSGPRRPAPAPKRPSRARKIAGVVALLATGGVALVGGKMLFTLNRATGGGSMISKWETIKDPLAKFPGRPNRINILLAGRDYNTHWGNLGGAQESQNSRSDSIMLLSLDTERKTVSALSIPRDTWVTAPDGKEGKINGTMVRGGAKLLAETVGQVVGVKPDYYVAIRPDIVREVVDQLGGVEVETKDAMQYDDAAARLHIRLPQGRQVINGEQAIGFARFREADPFERDENGMPIYTGRKDAAGNPIFVRRKQLVRSKEEGDPNRMARQQQLVRAIVAKAKSPSNWFKLDEVVTSGMDKVETNLEREQLFALAVLFRNFQPDQMQSGTLLGRGHKGRTYYFVPDPDKTKLLVDWLVRGDETAANRLTVVSVHNATDISGAARRVAEKLRDVGFDAQADPTVPDLGSLPPVPADASDPAATPDATTRVVYKKAAVAARAKRIAALLGVPEGRVVKDMNPAAAAEGSEYEERPTDVTVVLGRDVATANGPRSARR